MRIKPGVSIKGIEPEIVLCCVIIDPILRKYGSERLTSGVEGKHMIGSLHPKGLAIDVSLPSFGSNSEIIKELKEALGEDKSKNIKSEFDVVLEATHIHIEFDPKD